MRYLASAALGIVGIVALTATSALAAIVCNGEGDCWHVKKKYDYRSKFNVQVYTDDWRWAEADNGKFLGASMMDPAIGAAASGSASSALLGRGPSTSLLGQVRLLSPLAVLVPPSEPIAPVSD